MKATKLVLAWGACLVLGLLAASVADASVILPMTNNQAQILNYERVENEVGSPDNVLEVGERTRGIFTVSSMSYPWLGTGPVGAIPELTGIFDVTVAKILFVGNALGNDYYHLLFGPSGAAGGLDTLVGTSGSGVMLALYEDSANNLATAMGTPGITQAQLEAAATDGVLQGAYGMPLGGSAADPLTNWGLAGNGYWYAQVAVPTGGSIPEAPPIGSVEFYNGLTSFNDVGYLRSLGPYTPLYNDYLPGIGGTPAGTNIGNNVGLNHPMFGGGTLFDVVVHGTLKPTNLSNIAGIYPTMSNDPVQFVPNPEPGTLVIWGLLGLCTVGGTILRRRRAA